MLRINNPFKHFSDNKQEYQAKQLKNHADMENDKQEHIKLTRLSATDLKMVLLQYSANKLDQLTLCLQFIIKNTLFQ